MRRYPRWFALIVLLALATSSAQAAPPVAPIRDVVDPYWGTQVHDPYRYMEDLKSPEVQTWMKSQADYTDAALAKCRSEANCLHDSNNSTQAHPFGSPD